MENLDLLKEVSEIGHDCFKPVEIGRAIKYPSSTQTVCAKRVPARRIVIDRSLPGTLPGSLPESLPGSLPGSLSNLSLQEQAAHLSYMIVNGVINAVILTESTEYFGFE